MKNKVFILILVPVSIVLIGIFIYPTLYKYDKLDQKYPVKINRLTGETMVLKLDGWTDMTKPFFSVGSTKEEVIKSMGKPDFEYTYIDQWSYGNSLIRFDKGERVSHIFNNDKNLRIK